MLSEISQLQRTNMIPEILVFMETESRMVVARNWGERGLKNFLLGMEFPFYKVVKVSVMDGGDSCTAMGMYFMPLNYILRNG
jgi:hypothetical protein